MPYQQMIQPMLFKCSEIQAFEWGSTIMSSTEHMEDNPVCSYLSNKSEGKASQKIEKEPLEKNGKTKMVVKMLGKVPNLALPDDWIGVCHESGGIIYLHKKSRVVTWSRPYHIGNGSLRKHSPPVFAFPCLHQKLSLCNKPLKRKRKFCSNDSEYQKKLMKTDEERQENSFDIDVDENREIACGSVDERTLTVSNNAFSDAASCEGMISHEELSSSDTKLVNENPEEDSCNDIIPFKKSLLGDNPRKDIHRWDEDFNIQTNIVDHLEVIASGELHKYLNKIFEFDLLSDSEAQKPIFGEGNREEEETKLPEAFKTIPYAATTKNKGKEFSFTPGVTPLAMLQEYCNNKLKKTLHMNVIVGDNEKFIADAVIDGVRYGKGEGKSKRTARQAAAEKTMQILLPKQFGEISDFQFTDKELSVFDELDIEDPSVGDCARSTGLPLPAQVLSMCLKRNRGLCDANIIFRLKTNESNDLHTYEIECGKHTATGRCKNRRTGKQLASQAILKKIHPKLENWGQLVRLYCEKPKGLIRILKKQETEFSELPRSNADLMRELKSEMLQLERKAHKKASSLQPSSTSTSTIPYQDLDLG